MSNLLTCLLLIMPLIANEPIAKNPAAADLTEPAPKLRSVGPVDVAPTGWRRTVRGWERAENWPTADGDSQAVALNRVIQKQRNAELSWSGGRGLSTVMQFVRQISPVTLVCSQVTLLALYIALVFHRESKTGNRKCPKPTNLYR